MSAGKLQIATPGDREIVFTRVFNAPRQFVWDAHTKPELVRRWLLGPPGWTMPVCEIDLRVGGKYRYVWRNADGREMGMGGEHREIVPPERVVTTQLFDEDWTGGETIVTLVLTESGGQTTMTSTVVYASTAARDGAMQTGMAEGMEAGYARLDELLRGCGEGASQGGPRAIGEFCWFNMLTPQPAAAREFFGKLLGWTYAEIPGVGHRAQIGGKDIGGIFDLSGPHMPPGTPPYIGVMVRVESADATVEKVRSLGGTAQPAFDVFDTGRMAVCFDPNGAGFDIWEAKASQGMEADAMQHGAPSWFETITSDTARAAQFYGDLLGWVAEKVPYSPVEYSTFKLSDKPVGGMLPIMPEMGGFKPCWSTYFTVADIDASYRLAGELGATTCMPITPVPGVGRFCTLLSPQGVMFYLIEYER